MSAITFDLPEYRLEEVAGHLERTYHMRYGGLERSEALLFRLPFGHHDVVRTEPPAVFLRELAAAVRSGTVEVKAAGMGKRDRYVVSELLRQSAYRVQGGDARDRPVADALDGLALAWDKVAGVRGTEAERTARIEGWRG